MIIFGNTTDSNYVTPTLSKEVIMESVSMFNGKFVLALVAVGIVVAFLANGFSQAQPAFNEKAGTFVNEQVLTGKAGETIFNR